ncbi:MAG: phosphotyrosine protein phosphatase [Aliishimia sp.]
MNILFICSMNKWRSPTGEAIFWRHDGVNTRSAGTSRKARRQVSVTDIRWADLICVMEEKHLSRLRADFRGEVKRKAIHVLDIPDHYHFMDPELVDLICDAVKPMIDTANEP